MVTFDSAWRGSDSLSASPEGFCIWPFHQSATVVTSPFRKITESSEMRPWSASVVRITIALSPGASWRKLDPAGNSLARAEGRGTLPQVLRPLFRDRPQI